MHYFVLLSALAAIFVSREAAKPRSINVALETVFVFDNSSDVDFINQVQEMLNKVKNFIKDYPTQNVSKSTKQNKRYKFTDFLEDILDTLFAFNDEDLEEIVQIFDSEFKKNIQTNALQENIRRYLTNELGRIKNKPVHAIRKSLDKLLRKVQDANNDKKNNFLGFINTLYKRDAEEKLAKLVRNLKIFRRNSHKVKKDSVKKAIQFVVFEHFSNLSEDTKRMAELRLKDYLGDRLSIAPKYTKNYPRINDKPRNVKFEPALVLQNSEDTETSKETIDIEERNFKPKLDINKPHLVLDRSEDTELISTKTFAKNEIVKHNKDRELVAKTTDKNDNLPQVTYKKFKRGHSQKFKKINKYSNKIYSNKKLTLYPGNIKMKKKNLKLHFRATIPVTLNGDKITRTKEDRTLGGINTFTSHNPEENVNLKNNKIQFVLDDSKDDIRKSALMKVRALRKKLMESRTNRVELATPKSSDEYFGSLFKSKGITVDRSDSRRFINSTYRLREFLNQIEDETKTSNARNKFNKMHRTLKMPIENNPFKNTEGDRESRLTKKLYVTENKSAKKLNTTDMSTEYTLLDNSGYRRAKGANKRNRTLETIKPIENDGFLAEKLHVDENNYNFTKTNDVATDNNEKLADFKFLKNKTENIFKTIEISTESNDLVKYRGFKRIKEPKKIENVSLSLTTTNKISNVANNFHTDELTLENELESTTKKFLNTHKKLVHVISYTKADKVIDKAEEIINLQKINSVNNLKKHSKISRRMLEKISTYKKPITNQREKETINFTNSDDFSKIINITDPIINSKHTNDIIQSDSKRNSKNINELQVLKTKKDASITTKINRNPKLTSVKQKITTESHNKEIETMNYKINNSIWQEHLNPNVTENEKLNTKLQVNNENKTKEFNPISLDNTNDSRRQFTVNTKTSTIGRDEKLDVDFQRTTEIDLSLDIKKYLKNPGVTDVENNLKKKEIEQKIKEDLGKLLTLPATNATTTAAYTDIFEVMENDFGLGPLK